MCSTTNKPASIRNWPGIGREPSGGSAPGRKRSPCFTSTRRNGWLYLRWKSLAHGTQVWASVAGTEASLINPTAETTDRRRPECRRRGLRPNRAGAQAFRECQPFFKRSPPSRRAQRPNPQGVGSIRGGEAVFLQRVHCCVSELSRPASRAVGKGHCVATMSGHSGTMVIPKWFFDSYLAQAR